MSAPLPELPEVECPRCEGEGMKAGAGFPGVCRTCEGKKTVTAIPPDKCPWCHAENAPELIERAASWGVRYPCTRTSAWAYPGTDCPPPRALPVHPHPPAEWMNKPFGEMDGDGECSRVPAESREMVMTYVADWGLNLYEALAENKNVALLLGAVRRKVE